MTITDVERAVAALAQRGDTLPPDTAWDLIQQSRTQSRPLAALLTGRVNDVALTRAIADELSLEFVDLESPSCTYRVDPDVVARADMATLEDRVALPLLDQDGNVVIATVNPRTDGDLLDYLRVVYPDGVRLALGVARQLAARLAVTSTDTVTESTVGTEGAGRGVNEWLDAVLLRAAADGTSDVHFMTQAGSLLVRFRVDGDLRPVSMPFVGRENEVVGALLSRCPTIDPTDRTRPQDGSFSFAGPGGRRIDVRISMLPLLHGPLVVARILDPRNVQRSLDDMGLAPDVVAALREASQASQGLVLMSGPTGSGKTTTLYGLLGEMDVQRRHVLTAEDPVEYRLPHVAQTQIRANLGDRSITFARALRSFLRLDPDVILVGEIRDGETAEVAMHASLTGHLVLSTIHANSAIGVVQRLDELGGEPFLVAESLAMALSQRLLRVVHDCHVMEAPTEAEAAFLTRLNLPVPDRVAHARGCAVCHDTGFRGRQAVVGMFRPNAAARELIGTRAPLQDIVEAAGSGLYRISEDAHRHVLAGQITVTELARVVDSGRGGR